MLTKLLVVAGSDNQIRWPVRLQGTRVVVECAIGSIKQHWHIVAQPGALVGSHTLGTAVGLSCWLTASLLLLPPLVPLLPPLLLPLLLSWLP